MELWLPAAAAAIATGFAIRVWYKGWRRRRIASRRRVEAPNSEYSSPGVREHEDRERWRSIELGGLHPLNQEEVRRLWGVVDAEGVRALSPQDRLFLDNMASRGPRGGIRRR